MIGKLKGILSELDGNTALIETKACVSYQTYITPDILSKTKVGDNVEFYTYLQVREDALTLFAFETKDERSLFDLLLAVPGVGPKTAYLVISYAKVDALTQAVKEHNIDFFSRVRGLGKKTAMKIILELSQKLKQEFELKKMYISEEDKTVIDALVALGFKSHDASSIVSKLPKKLSVEDKIKESLKTIK